MKNYIVRVYRQQQDQAQQLVGIVEEVGVDGRKGFTNIEDLWEIFINPAGKTIHSDSMKTPKGRYSARRKASRGGTL